MYAILTYLLTYLNDITLNNFSNLTIHTHVSSKLNDDFNISNPKLEQFVPVARNTCSNIADNPVHQTMQVQIHTLIHHIRTYIHTYKEYILGT